LTAVESVRSRVRHIGHEQPIGHTLLEVPGSPPRSFAGIEDRRALEVPHGTSGTKSTRPQPGWVAHRLNWVEFTNAAAAIMALLLGWLFGRFGERNQQAGRTS